MERQRVGAVQLDVYLILFGKAIKKKAASICMEFKPFQSLSLAVSLCTL